MPEISMVNPTTRPTMTKRFKIEIEATVLADTSAEAVQIPQRALGASDKIESYTTGRIAIAASS